MTTLLDVPWSNFCAFVKVKINQKNAKQTNAAQTRNKTQSAARSGQMTNFLWLFGNWFFLSFVIFGLVFLLFFVILFRFRSACD